MKLKNWVVPVALALTLAFNATKAECADRQTGSSATFLTHDIADPLFKPFRGDYEAVRRLVHAAETAKPKPGATKQDSAKRAAQAHFLDLQDKRDFDDVIDILIAVVQAGGYDQAGIDRNAFTQLASTVAAETSRAFYLAAREKVINGEANGGEVRRMIGALAFAPADGPFGFSVADLKATLREGADTAELKFWRQPELKNLLAVKIEMRRALEDARSGSRALPTEAARLKAKDEARDAYIEMQARVLGGEGNLQETMRALENVALAGGYVAAGLEEADVRSLAQIGGETVVRAEFKHLMPLIEKRVYIDLGCYADAVRVNELSGGAAFKKVSLRILLDDALEQNRSARVLTLPKGKKVARLERAEP